MSRGGLLRPWFEEFPERLAWEREQLAARGWSFELDEEAHRRGRIVLRDDVRTALGARRLVLVFPDSFPEQRVTVYDETPGDPLPLHQAPYERNLCLLDNLPTAWVPDDSAADMVDRALVLYQALADGPEALKRISVPAPEPRSTYYPYASDSAVIVPAELVPAPGDGGTFTYKLRADSTPWRGVVAAVGNAAGSRGAPLQLLAAFGGEAVSGPWFRVQAPPWRRDVEAFRAWALETVPQFERRVAREAKPVYGPAGELRVWALVYEDQGPDGPHDQWLLCLSQKKDGQRRTGFVRPFIFSAAEQEGRIASLAGLRGKRVVVVGLGTLGAPIALELGRTNLLEQMFLIDEDHYTVWNLVRHPLDLDALGSDKAAAVAARVRAAAPLVEVSGARYRIGVTPAPDGACSDFAENLVRELSAADLIVDATADVGASLFLNRVSLRAEVPLLVVSVTEGGWGGEVVRSIPGVTGCIECYRWGADDGTYPAPSQDPAATPIFTRGCGFPTFQGTGFDAMALAADATRLAVQTLLRGTDGYPDAPYDVLVRHNRRAGSDAGVPHYETAVLNPHPKCMFHAAAA